LFTLWRSFAEETGVHMPRSLSSGVPLYFFWHFKEYGGVGEMGTSCTAGAKILHGWSFLLGQMCCSLFVTAYLCLWFVKYLNVGNFFAIL
jgi:hypothetical protein